MNENRIQFALLVAVLGLAIIVYGYGSYQTVSSTRSRLERYIEKRIAMGHPDADIHATLLHFGWSEKDIHHRIGQAKTCHDLATLEHYIVGRLSRGHSEKEIHQTLAKMGWHPSHIKKHTKNAKKILRS